MTSCSFLTIFMFNFDDFIFIFDDYMFIFDDFF